MNILITICARGGSRGVPDKNIKLLNGVPLIAYSIKRAKEVMAALPEVYFDLELSTDSERIKSVAAHHGLNTNYSRPDQYATDKAGKVVAIEHVMRYAEAQKGKTYDYVLDLDVTSPLRTVQDITESFTLMEKNKAALTLFSVNPAHRNPYFNMVEVSEEGYAVLVKSAKETFLSRQATPKVYDLNASFYFYRRAFFDTNMSSVITSKSLIYEMSHACFDIDSILDFEIMSFLIQNNKLDFEL